MQFDAQRLEAIAQAEGGDEVVGQVALVRQGVPADLRGFGKSSKPADTPDHAGASKRAKARDCVALMETLGFPTFAVAGHDRGCYVAYRTALDHPERVSKLAVLDGIPIIERLERCDARFAQAWWHWFFYAQPDKPERAIAADPEAWYGASAERMGADTVEVASGHCAMVSHPQDVLALIQTAAQAARSQA